MMSVVVLLLLGLSKVDIIKKKTDVLLYFFCFNILFVVVEKGIDNQYTYVLKPTYVIDSLSERMTSYYDG